MGSSVAGSTGDQRLCSIRDIDFEESPTGRASVCKVNVGEIILAKAAWKQEF
ncbi:hypothetical protein [Leptospira weilii]|uniref:hypothetical protein n=1 Tax=Leptospira weilii TaxID=28184 RepID=UPI0002FA5D71|nr:hypothetical protein [Leptospira weilii]